MKQLTLSDSFTLSGHGLHSGLEVTATFLPAPVGTGYVFRRTDLEGAPSIEALAEYVVNTDHSTTIKKGQVSVSTIEHALGALYAAGIDNVIIEINAPEMPILDGSAKPYTDAIDAVGLKEQDKEKEFYYVKRRMEVKDEETGSSIVLLPDDQLSVDVKLKFDSKVAGSQFATLEAIEDFPTEIAQARTFVFIRQIQPLVEAGLIKGGELSNALVVYDTEIPQAQLDELADKLGVEHRQVSELGYISDKPLWVDNELARHKIIDVLGDLALIGRPLIGRIIATKPGHTINTRMAKELRKEIKHQPVQAPVYDPTKEPVLDINQIRSFLPHRYPFALVDKIIEKGDGYVVGIKNVTINEPFFQGHFPSEPVMPGVLQIEAMAQTGGLLVLSSVEEPERYSTYFMKIDNVKFRRKVVPGDTLIFHVSFLTPLRRGCAVMKGYAFVGDEIVSECEFMAQIIKNK